MSEKTEKATPKKIRDARKKGQVAKSQDFPAACTFIASLSLIVVFSAYLFKNLSGYMEGAFHLIATINDRTVLHLIPAAIFTILQSSLPILVLVAGIGVLVNFLIVGPLFSFQSMKPDIKRLNPVTNIKNLFKLKTMIELLKSIFKIAGAVIIIYFVIKNSLPEIILAVKLPLIGSALIFSNFLLKVVIRVGIFFLFVAALDLFFQRRNFSKEMMMEKFEIKQEMKDTEGDPQLKSRRRQTAQELAYQEGPMAAKNARAIITNPTHIAIAIQYKATQQAPKIITMGKGFVAKKIIEVATQNNIPIMRNPPLAQELYYKGEIDEFIPEETYEAVAEILRWLEQVEKAEFKKEIFE